MTENWDKLQVLLAPDEFETVRHSGVRKTDNWRDAEQAVVYVKRSVVDKLAHATFDEDSNPFDTLSDQLADSIFVAHVDSIKYPILVNTEGFSYSRYIAKLIIVD
jgi:hypothetical protein